uniref:F-box protein At5g07610 n=1 Tax=Elaeis guineensis var. tenera TaxID=51953 RepID=A0A6I9R893_ELAGV|nr:F-box protein At5g07610 [Elaeis guineensis]
MGVDRDCVYQLLEASRMRPEVFLMVKFGLTVFKITKSSIYLGGEEETEDRGIQSSSSDWAAKKKWRAKRNSKLREMSSSSSAAKATISNRTVFEILSRLPAKSVLRFKCVCRLWLALASDPLFLDAHTRRNPFTISGFLIHEIGSARLSSYSVDGGALAVLPDPSLSYLDHLFAESCGLLLCRSRSPLLSSSQFLVNPTTMQYRQIPNPPTDVYPFKCQFMLAFDPSTSLRYRIACLCSNNEPSAFNLEPSPFHVQIYSSETGAWELSRVPVPGGRITQKGVYWNAALNWITEDGLLVSFDVDQQLVRITRLPLRDPRGVMLYLGESRGHLHLIETAEDVGRDNINWLRFFVFEMRKDNRSWSILYHVDLNDVRIEYPLTKAPLPNEISLGILSDYGIYTVPVFFARGGEREDDQMYFTYPPNIFCCNLGNRTFYKICATKPRTPTIQPNLPVTVTIHFFPFAQSLLSKISVSSVSSQIQILSAVSWIVNIIHFGCLC